MKITIEMLKNEGACEEGLRWVKGHQLDGAECQDYLDAFADGNVPGYAGWLRENFDCYSNTTKHIVGSVFTTEKNIYAVGNLKITGTLELTGDIDVCGNITADEHLIINGSVHADGSISVAGNIYINGYLSSHGSITAGLGISCDATIAVSENITATENIKAGQSILAGGDISTKAQIEAGISSLVKEYFIECKEIVSGTVVSKNNVYQQSPKY